jgi:hypothetical protein
LIYTGAVAERLGGFGHVLHVHRQTTPNLHAMNFCQLSSAARANVVTLPLHRVNDLLTMLMTPAKDNHCDAATASLETAPASPSAAAASTVLTTVSPSASASTSSSSLGVRGADAAMALCQAPSVIASLALATDLAVDPLALIMITLLAPSVRFASVNALQCVFCRLFFVVLHISCFLSSYVVRLWCV